jgi:hypothetical protein
MNNDRRREVRRLAWGRPRFGDREPPTFPLDLRDDMMFPLLN